MTYLTMETLSRHLDQDTQGVLWMSSESDPANNPHFHLLDYFFDGLLVNHHNVFDDSHQMKFFSTQHFGHPFFLLRVHQDTTSDQISQALEIVRPRVKNQSKIFVLSEDEEIKKNLLPKLQKKSATFIFS